jgi:AraC-like DNA-binding protein
MNNDLHYKFIKPEKSLADFVESFWFLKHQSHDNTEKIVVPDGKIDLFFSKSETEPFHITLIGLETKPKSNPSYPNSVLCAVSFKPLAVEYILRHSIAGILDNRTVLPNDFWNFDGDDLDEFDIFCKKATQKIKSLLPQEIDNRKQKLFELIYATNGAISVKELSDKAFWSRQQINRYFNKQFGLSSKAYCNIIRFRASFQHIKDGKLFPQQNFADQSHFIKEVKKHSSVLPKELKRNQNERFIQFSVLDPK